MDEFASRICLAPADSLRDFLRGFGQPISNVAKQMPIVSRHNKTDMFPSVPVHVPGPLLASVGEALARVKQSEWADLGASVRDTPPTLSPKTLQTRSWCGVLLNYLQPRVRGMVSRFGQGGFFNGSRSNILSVSWPDSIGHSLPRKQPSSWYQAIPSGLLSPSPSRLLSWHTITIATVDQECQNRLPIGIITKLQFFCA